MKGNTIERKENVSFDAALFKTLKTESLKYLFDWHDKNENYYYFIQNLPVKRLGKQAIFQGDIILESNVSDNGKLDTVTLEKVKRIGKQQLVGVDALSEKRMWPNGVVRYMISGYGVTNDLKPAIQQAISAWQATGLKFQQITTYSGDFIFFEAKTDYMINASPLGKGNGKQIIQLRPDAGTGNIIHEIGHSLGLWHEHSRFDRNQFITIEENNIDSNCREEFEMIKDKYSFYDTKYDYESIMHYDAYAFAKTGPDGHKLITIKTIPPGKSIGQRNGLSAGDLAGIKKMYHL